MATFSLAALKTELEQDPAGLGYAAHLSTGADGLLADLLNDPREAFKQPRPIPINRLLQWTAKHGILEKIDDGSRNSLSAVRSICLAALTLLAGSAAPEFDAVEEDNAAMIDALVTAGVMTAQQRTDLLEFAKSAASRAEVLWGLNTRVSHSLVALALRG